MRLDDYILEDTKISTEEGLEDIKKNCSEYIRELRSGRNLFVRLSESYKPIDHNKILIIPPKSDRIPIDTPKDVHHVIDNLLKAKFGWKPRSEALFVWITEQKNPRWNWYSFWKEVRLIFPIDGYKYVYSSMIGDLFLKYETFLNDYDYPIYPDSYDDNKINNDIKDKFFEWFKNKGLPTYTKLNALRMGATKHKRTECMLKAKKYYAISSLHIPRLNDLFNLDIQPSRYKITDLEPKHEFNMDET